MKLIKAAYVALWLATISFHLYWFSPLKFIVSMILIGSTVFLAHVVTHGNLHAHLNSLHSLAEEMVATANREISDLKSQLRKQP